MITRLTAAIVALLAFAGMILAGLAADNPFETVIGRALVGLLVGLAVGHVAGLIARYIIHEYFSAMIERDTQAELAAAGVSEDSAAIAAEVTAAQAPDAASIAQPAAKIAEAKNSAAVAKATPPDSRKSEHMTREQTFSAHAAREMQKQL